MDLLYSLHTNLQAFFKLDNAWISTFEIYERT